MCLRFHLFVRHMEILRQDNLYNSNDNNQKEKKEINNEVSLSFASVIINLHKLLFGMFNKIYETREMNPKPDDSEGQVLLERSLVL